MKGNEPGRAPQNQAAEITKLIMQHRNMIFGYAMTQTGDYDAAEDIFQDICVTICEKFAEFRKGTNFKAWAMEIARYKILSHYQQQSTRKKRMVHLTEEIADSLAANPVWLQEERPFVAELSALRKCLDRTKGKSRAILLKRYGEGLSCKAVAESIGWTVNAVYVALSRIRDALEKCVKSGLLVNGKGT